MIQAPEAWSVSNGSSDKVMIMSWWGVDMNHLDNPSPVPISNCGGMLESCNGSDSLGWQSTVGLGAWMSLRNHYEAVGAAPGIQAKNLYGWRLIAPGQTSWTLGTVVDGLNSAIGVGIKTLAIFQARWLTVDNTVALAFANAGNHDIVMLAGAFGDGTTTYYPVSYSQVYGVAGVLRDMTFADSTAPANECDNQSGWGSGKVDVAAPWTATVTTSRYPNWFGQYCGVTLATAYAAGVTSLIRSRWPSWPASQVVNRLVSTATPAGDAAHFGSGVVNARRAVLMLSASISPPSAVQPFATCTWTASASGGTAPYTFSWTAAGTSGSGPYFDYTNAATDGGSFTIQVNVTDATGLAGFATKTVAVSSSAPPCNY